MVKKNESKQKHGRAIDKPCPKCGSLRCVNCGGKYCTACEEWKPYSEFTRASEAYDGYYTKCRTCKKSASGKRDLIKKRATNRSYRERHREEILAREKLARAANPEKYRAYSRKTHAKYTREQWKGFMLRTRYGLTLEEYLAMVERQQGRCKICGRESENLVVDHKHDETQKVRGLLCDPCNQALGLMLDDTDRISAAIAYLQFDGAYDRAKHKVIFRLEKIMKRCSACGIEKLLTEFARDSSKNDGYDYRCRDCRKQYFKTYYTSERIRRISLKRKYGITPEEYDQLVAQQQGKCKICCVESTKLMVDHKHDATQKVRGLLCNACNHAIGLFREDISTLLAAVAYLRLDGAYDANWYTASYTIQTERNSGNIAM